MITKAVHYRPRSKHGYINTVASVYCYDRCGGLRLGERMPNNDCLTTDVERVTCDACLDAMVEVCKAKKRWLHECKVEQQMQSLKAMKGGAS